MDYARRLPDHPVRLTRWTATAEVMSCLAGIPEDNRPLTTDQHGRLRQAFGPQSDDGSAPWIAITTRLENADERSIAGMWRRFFGRHESLRATYRGICTPNGDWTFTRRILAPEQISFQPEDLGMYADRHSAWAAITREFARGALPSFWPAAALITAQDGPDAIVFAAFDHVTYDGYSAYLTVDELPHLHRCEIEGIDAVAPAGSYLDFAVTQHRAQETLTADSECLTPWRNALSEEGTLPGLPHGTGVSRDMAVPHRMSLEPLATPAQTASFVSFCKTRYVPVGLGFSALLLHAIQAEELTDQISVLMSTHNRDQPQYHHAIGWFAGVAPLTVDLPAGLALTEAMQRVAEGWVHSTTASILTLPLVNDLLGAKAVPSLVLSYLDAHRCPGWQDWTRNGAEVLLGPIPSSDQTHLWINVMPEQTELLFRIPDTQDCRNWITRVASRMRDQLTQIDLDRAAGAQDGAAR